MLSVLLKTTKMSLINSFGCKSYKGLLYMPWLKAGGKLLTKLLPAMLLPLRAPLTSQPRTSGNRRGGTVACRGDLGYFWVT